MSKLPVTVIVAHRPDRKEFFEGYCLPSIEANRPERIIVMDEIGVPTVLRNKGAAMVKSDYMFHADDDIIFRSDLLEKEVEALDRNPEYAFCYSDFLWITLEEAQALHPFYKPLHRHRGKSFDLEALKKDNYIDTSSLIRTSLFPGFDEDPAISRIHDWEMWLRMGLKGLKGLWIPEVLYHAYNTDAGLTATQDYETAKARVMEKLGLPHVAS